MRDDNGLSFGRRASDALMSPALEVLRQVPAAAAVVLTAWLFLGAQDRTAQAAAEHARTQTSAVLTALASNSEALLQSTRAMARVELLLQQAMGEK